MPQKPKDKQIATIYNYVHEKNMIVPQREALVSVVVCRSPLDGAVTMAAERRRVENDDHMGGKKRKRRGRWSSWDDISQRQELNRLSKYNDMGSMLTEFSLNCLDEMV